MFEVLGSTIIITLIIKHRGVNYSRMRKDVYLYFEYFFPIKRRQNKHVSEHEDRRSKGEEGLTLSR